MSCFFITHRPTKPLLPPKPSFRAFTDSSPGARSPFLHKSKIVATHQVMSLDTLLVLWMIT